MDQVNSLANVPSMTDHLRLTWFRFWGRLANLSGLPCHVQVGRYESRPLGVSVNVRASTLYTIVCVNGVDVYFRRISGAFDGISVSPSSCTEPDAGS